MVWHVSRPMVAWILARPARPQQPYLAAVLDDAAACERHLNDIPDSLRRHCTIEACAERTFPCFAAKDQQGIRFLSEAEVMTELTQANSTRKDDEWCYVNLYRLTAEYVPHKPGTDYMGILPHWHIDNSLLDIIERSGLAVLWRAAE
jgi:hypothetical protein